MKIGCGCGEMYFRCGVTYHTGFGDKEGCSLRWKKPSAGLREDEALQGGQATVPYLCWLVFQRPGRSREGKTVHFTSHIPYRIQSPSDSIMISIPTQRCQSLGPSKILIMRSISALRFRRKYLKHYPPYHQSDSKTEGNGSCNQWVHSGYPLMHTREASFF